MWVLDLNFPLRTLKQEFLLLGKIQLVLREKSKSCDSFLPLK